MADWSQLPEELLGLIAQRLDCSFDLVHFRSVCSSWRSSAPPRSCSVSLRCSCPLDGVGYEDDCYVSRSSIFLFRSSRCHQGTTPHCWLVKLRDEFGKKELQYPLLDFGYNKSRSDTRTLLFDSLNIQVVELGHEYLAYCNRRYGGSEFSRVELGQVAFMQLHTGNGDHFAMLRVQRSTNLTMFRSTDKQWTVLESGTKRFHDIVSFNGKFYAIDDSGRTFVVDPSLNVTSFSEARPHARVRKFVRSGSELLLAEIIYDYYEDSAWTLDDQEKLRMIQGKVFKLDEARKKWDRMEDLGDRVLFLGDYSSFSCPAREIPGVNGNCVFFYENFFMKDPLETVLVFDLADGSVRWIEAFPGYRDLFWPPSGSPFIAVYTRWSPCLFD